MKKKVQQYCEVIQPLIWEESLRIAANTRNKEHLVRDSSTFIFLGTDTSGNVNVIRDESGNAKKFECALDAVNYLSQHGGWHLFKTFVGGGFIQHWIMTREVWVDE